MDTARSVVIETARLPPPDDDCTAIIAVRLVGDAIESWSVDAYVLHLPGRLPCRLDPVNLERPLPALAARLQRQVTEWLDANRAQIAEASEK